MKRYTVLFLLFTFISISRIYPLDEKTISISGRVIDKDTRDGVGYATVFIVANKQWYAVADSLGYFKIRNILPGIYSLSAVCQGYATLFYRVAKECGLKVRAIRGTSRGEGHMWNIVKIGQYYYNLDATWDEGVTKYRYYLKGSEDFDSHVAESAFETEEFKNQYII